MDKNRLFINFSNHPSCNWSDAQLAAAKRYGDIRDLPFPAVNEHSSEEDVSLLADSFVSQILSLGKPEDLTVHIMGEMTFTFMAVTRLKQHGIRCVASTTERKVTCRSDGTKVSEFSFVRFREY